MQINIFKNALWCNRTRLNNIVPQKHVIILIFHFAQSLNNSYESGKGIPMFGTGDSRSRSARSVEIDALIAPLNLPQAFIVVSCVQCTTLCRPVRCHQRQTCCEFIYENANTVLDSVGSGPFV